jgi:hypothetical protein
MSTTSILPAAPTPAPAVSFLTKLWDWVKGKVVIVEADMASVLGSKATADLEAIGKTLLDSWVGPLAVSALSDATDVATGQMSVSKAISSLVAGAASSGKSLSQAAALQVIALAQNALPTATDNTVTPTT